MSIYGALPISIEPEVVLVRWKVYEVDSELWPGKTRHFVGSMGWGRDDSRVSSEIKVFDPKKRYGITRSGRVYHLKSASSNEDEYGERLFKYWCENNKITNIVDVSKDYEGPEKNSRNTRKNTKSLGKKSRSKINTTNN